MWCYNPLNVQLLLVCKTLCLSLPSACVKALSDKALNSCRVKKTRHEINMLSVKDTIERYCKLKPRRYFPVAFLADTRETTGVNFTPRWKTAASERKYVFRMLAKLGVDFMPRFFYAA